MDYESLYADLTRVLEDLAEKSRTVPVIVEGERDRKALLALGIDGDVLALNQGTSLFALCESIARRHREAVILTDWDVRGGRLARQLRDGLAANGVRFDVDLRARLTTLCRREIKDVESLHLYVARLEEMLETRNRSKPSKRYYAGKAQRWAMRREKPGAPP